MGFWAPFPILRWFLFFLVGLLLAPLIALPNNYFLYYSILVVSALLASIIFKRVFTFISLLFWFWLIGLGLTISAIHPNYKPKENSIEALLNSQFSIVTIQHVKERKSTYQYEVSIKQLLLDSSWYSINENGILTIPKDSLKTLYSEGEIVLLKARWRLINATLPTAEFDYKAYMASQGINFQAYSDNSVALLEKESKENFITSMHKKLDAVWADRSTLGIAKGILLGDKGLIDSTEKNRYAAAGVAHILAISGMHVGIIFFLLQLIIPKQLFKANNQFYQSLFIAFILWFYAFITGFSPSVVRAVSLFSLYAITNGLRRDVHPFQLLAITAFIWLIIYPSWLYDIGFQLSYTAMMGIFFFQPLIQKVIKTNQPVLNYLRDILAVGLSAQLATFPFTLYYFHQFPSYFLISNLLISPLLTLALPLGIFTLLIPSHWLLSDWVGQAAVFFFSIIQEVSGLIASWPNAVIRPIWLSELMLAALCVVMLSLALWIHYKRWYWIAVILIGAIGFFEANRHYKTTLYTQYDADAYIALERGYLQFVHHQMHSLILYREGESEYAENTFSKLIYSKAAEDIHQQPIANILVYNEKGIAIYHFQGKVIIKAKSINALRRVMETVKADYIIVPSYLFAQVNEPDLGKAVLLRQYDTFFSPIPRQ